METPDSPAVAVLRATPQRLHDADVLPPAPLATIARRARRRRTRHRVAGTLSVVVAGAALTGLALARQPAPEQRRLGATSRPSGGERTSAGTVAPPPIVDASADVIVFMNPTATMDQIDAMNADLQAD